MDACCEVHEVPRSQRRVLTIVLVVNLVMFFAEAAAGLLAHSTALLADSVDMLGDAIVYGFSLYVIQRGAVWQARAAMLKGVVMAAFGVGVLAQVGWKIVAGVGPDAHVMTVVGLAALVANVACLALLWRRRGDDINMRSAWLCSRNDVIGNTGVLIAAVAVAATASPWPDLLVGFGVAALFLRSAIRVMGDARRVVAAGA